jgi:hypothetical protein
VSFDDWLLALHLLTAFALVGALTLFSIVILAFGRTSSAERVVALAPVMMLGNIAVGVGTLGTLVFGVWLAIALDAYQVWDLWVILAIVGWFVAAGLGNRAGSLAQRAFREVKAGNSTSVDAFRDPMIARLHWASVVVTLLILIDMIWKPGA